MTVPFVRAVVLNWNGGAHVLEAVACLLRTDWPADRLAVVVVDNASTDGSDVAVERRFPQVEVRRNPTNQGFPGNNAAFGDLDGVDHVALVNNDAFVEPGWLAPLVATLEASPDLGAAAPKLLFAPRFSPLVVEAPTFDPGGGDPRRLAVRCSGVEVDGADQWRDTWFGPGCFPGEFAGRGEAFRWLGGRAQVGIPVPADGDADGGGLPPGPTVRARLRLSAPRPVTVRIRLAAEAELGVDGGAEVVAEGVLGAEAAEVAEVPAPAEVAEVAEVPAPAEGVPGGLSIHGGRPAVACRSGTDVNDVVTARIGPQPTWVEVPVGAVRFDVVQNAGSVLLEGGYGADRGFLQPDLGQLDEPVEVWAWCGGTTLLRADYLRRVGGFWPPFFMYYEDIDLAWRGRAQGWRYRYEPRSVVRHLHGMSAGEASPLFQHHVERNRLVVLARNAPGPLFRDTLVRYLLITASMLRSDLVTGLRHRRPPRLARAGRRLGSLAGFVRLAPRVLRTRRHLRRCQVVPDDELVAWMLPRSSHPA